MLSAISRNRIPAFASLLIATTFAILPPSIALAKIFDPLTDNADQFFKPLKSGTADDKFKLKRNVTKPMIKALLAMTDIEGDPTARRAEYRYQVEDDVADEFFEFLEGGLGYKSRDAGTGNKTDILNLGGGLKMRARAYPELTDSTFIEFKYKNSDTDVRKIRARFRDADLEDLLSPRSTKFAQKRVRDKLLDGARFYAEEMSLNFGDNRADFIKHTMQQAELIIDGVVNVRQEFRRRGMEFEFTHCSEVVRKGFAKGDRQVTQDSDIRTTSPQVINKILGRVDIPLTIYDVAPAKKRIVEVKRPEGDALAAGKSGKLDELSDLMGQHEGLNQPAGEGKTSVMMGRMRERAARLQTSGAALVHHETPH